MSDETSDDFLRLLQGVYMSGNNRTDSAIGTRLGAASTAETIRDLARARNDVYTVTENGDVTFNVTMKAGGETVTYPVTLKIVEGDTPDAARISIEAPPLERNSTFSGMIGDGQQAAIEQLTRKEIDGRLKELGVNVGVGNIRGKLPVETKGTVSQESIPAESYKAAREKLEAMPGQRQIGEQAVNDAIILAHTAPQMRERLGELIAIDPARDPQSFAAKLKEISPDVDVSMLDLVDPNKKDQAVKKLVEIHGQVKELAYRLEVDPVGTVRNIQHDAIERTARQAAETAAEGGVEALEALTHNRSLGDAARNLLRKAAGKLPMIGAGVVGAQMALSVADAKAAHAEGLIDDKQLAAAMAAYAGQETCSAAASVPLVGTAASVACEEGVEKAAAEAGVPENLRPGTTSQALNDMAVALAQATRPYRDATEARMDAQARKERWGDMEADLTIKMSWNQDRSGESKRIIEALRDIGKTDFDGAYALMEAMLKDPQHADAHLEAYQQARAALGEGGERLASANPDGAEMPSAAIARNTNEQAVAAAGR